MKLTKMDYRPRIHFTAPRNWHNDPNGLIFHDGVYHLYYQHYPDAHEWGPMHWGHATSQDLIHWVHHPIFMYPDELGFIFSGCAVHDVNNTSGLGTAENPPIVYIYTNDDPANKRETQSIAYSLDGGMTATKYAGNPVIPSPGFKDFRDPCVFWDEKKGRWAMMLAADDRAFIYGSPDLIHWTKVGEFGPGVNRIDGVYECPALIPLPYDGGTKWVYVCSIYERLAEGQTPDPNVSWRSQYFVGDFTGNAFVSTGEFDKPEFIDFGFDNYAGIIYRDADRPIFQAWAAGVPYMKDTPSAGYCSCMTLAREVKLVETERGARVAFMPVIPGGTFGEMEQFDGRAVLESDTFRMGARAEKVCVITLSNAAGERLVFGVNEEGEAFIDRSEASRLHFNAVYDGSAMSRRSEPRLVRGELGIEAVFDRSILEVYIDDGTRCGTAVVFPGEIYTSISVEGASSAAISYLR